MRVFATALAVLMASWLTASAADLSYKDGSATSVGRAGWNGFYVGVNGGYGLTNEGPTADGMLGGLTAGFNVQPGGGAFVFGAETDVQATDVSGSKLPRIDWFGTLRARAGVLIGSNVLVYGTGGMAYGGFIGDANLGWTAGSGAEWKIDPKWSVKGEYLYVDLESAVPPVDVFRIGVNYKLN